MAFAAGDTFTVNGSEQTGAKGVELTNAYAPFAAGTDSNCTGTANTNTGNCETFGALAVSAWLDQEFMGAGGNFVPDGNDTVNSSEDGSFTTQMTKSQFGVGNGLPTAWLSELLLAPDSPLTANDTVTLDAAEREEWVDQIAIGYVKSNQFAQNFRASITFGDSKLDDGNINRDGCRSDVTTCKSIIDQRLEQGDTGMNAAGQGTSEVTQAFQQAFGATSGPNTTTDPDFAGGHASSGTKSGMGQNIEQSAEGFFYSCLNCNEGSEHAFTPPEKLAYQTWPTRPTITKINHADSTSQFNGLQTYTARGL
jgi:hypothetical protein